jgi:hypothetical protein
LFKNVIPEILLSFLPGAWDRLGRFLASVLCKQVSFPNVKEDLQTYLEKLMNIIPVEVSTTKIKF